MIIHYNILFSFNRKVARICCKINQFVGFPFSRKLILNNINDNEFDYRDIPVLINNYNRVFHLRNLIEWLERAGMRHIYIIDNASSYPALIDYYKNTKHNVIRLNVNIGYKALWETSIHRWFRGGPYIYTDPDVLPVSECPMEAIKFLHDTLSKHDDINKVGFGLKIDDIPDCYHKKSEVIEWEKRFWDCPVEENLYKADIDTTFALYRANSVKQQWGKTLRTGGKYMIRHLPWYEDSNFVSEEESYYARMTIGSSWYSRQNEKNRQSRALLLLPQEK